MNLRKLEIKSSQRGNKCGNTIETNAGTIEVSCSDRADLPVYSGTVIHVCDQDIFLIAVKGLHLEIPWDDDFRRNRERVRAEIRESIEAEKEERRKNRKPREKVIPGREKVLSTRKGNTVTLEYGKFVHVYGLGKIERIERKLGLE